jgi:poly(3-hydroxybutyrate) depolymerase
VIATLKRILLGFLAASLLLTAADAMAAGAYVEVSYPPSTQPGELQLGVTYTLWIPDGVAKLRGIIVHQHGCGTGACKGGATAAYDLHWQALAKKWDCALLGPSYHQEEKQNCRLWCDPRNGSAKTFLQAIGDFAVKAKHPELETAPWCLWGHSGGGFWASLMQTMYPERIVAIWCRSGTALATWEKGEIPKPELSAAVYAIPVMCNPGAKENGDPRFNGAWAGAWAMFKAYRAQGAPIGLAPDPRTSHQCGDCRYLAIPFFDACLAMRLPHQGGADQRLRPVDLKAAWLATPLADQATPASVYGGKAEEAVWLPNERVAKAWAEYVKTGAVSDLTPPPTPRNVKATAKPDQAVEITWEAEADFESGIQAFLVQRDGSDLAQVPEKPVGRFGRPLFQTMSYHDTPEQPLPEMRLIDQSAGPATKHQYRVISVNSVGLRSTPSEPASTP